MASKHSSLTTISWLKFLRRVPFSRKQVLIGGILLLLVAYGGFVTYRAMNSDYCNDWVFSQDKVVKVGLLEFQKPNHWQQHYCYTDNEEDYEMSMLVDYQIPDTARIAWYLAVSDGWGMYAPTNAGRIEVSSGENRSGETISEMEARFAGQTLPSWMNRTIQHITLGGKDAIQIITVNDPEPNQKFQGRYGYLNDVLIEVDGRMYNLRLNNSWHKAESREAWIATYEPIFEQVLSSAEFK